MRINDVMPPIEKSKALWLKTLHCNKKHNAIVQLCYW